MRLIKLGLLSLLVISGCCKPPDKDMTTSFIPNRYTGLDSIYAHLASGDSVTIVCYGNSITYGVSATSGQQVADTYPKVFENQLRQHYSNQHIKVINEGHGGWTAENAAGGLDSLVLANQPDLVTLIYGINDLYQEKGLPNYRQNLQTMVQALQQHGISILVLSPTPLNNENNRELLEFCNTASEVAQTNNVAFFHMHGAMVDRISAETSNPKTLLPDGVHYTESGYRMIGEELMKYWLAKP
ncbi:hypothetical protein BH09BAC1_BH09BAC1_09950 [soil metagenome]